MCAVMTKVAERLAAVGWRLRSGHADGADQAFEKGACGQADIFLPWASFNKQVPVLGEAYRFPAQWAFDVAAEHHPKWEHLGQAVQKLMARNAHQLLGYDSREPKVSFVLCWTPEGAGNGGTGQAIRHARALDIPVFDMGVEATYDRVSRWLVDELLPV
jgi:hypothetical protein